MNAIQRWYIYSERSSEKLHEAAKGPDMILDGTERLWCREKDVETLETLVSYHTQRAIRARADRTIADDLVKSLRAEIIEKDIEITHLRYLINTHECGDLEDCHP